MLPQVLGYTVMREVPKNVLFGVLTGAYQVCGGVIRDNAGQIVAHLVSTATSGLAATSMLNPILGGANLAINAVNTLQLRGIAAGVKDLNNLSRSLLAATNTLVNLSVGTMALSGLTLAVSTAGFVYFRRRLDAIDKALGQIAKEVRGINEFLRSEQRAKLMAALKTLQNVADVPKSDLREKILVGSQEALGQLKHYYRHEFEQGENEKLLPASEEDFTITAVASALCAAELEMYEPAVKDLKEDYDFWLKTCRNVAVSKLTHPERYLGRHFAKSVRTDELIDWLDFAHNGEKGLSWIDELRAEFAPKASIFFPRRRSNDALSRDEEMEVCLLRKVTSRNRIYQGYCAQYEFFKENGVRPSTYQKEIDALDKKGMVTEKVNDAEVGVYVLVREGLADTGV